MTAWDVIGYQGDKMIRIVGGRTLYETAQNTRNDEVRLQRLAVTSAGLRIVTRYVKHDTEVELV